MVDDLMNQAGGASFLSRSDRACDVEYGFRKQVEGGGFQDY